MIIADKVYGTREVTSPLLIELIESSAMRRLKGIAQLGMPDELNSRDGYSRYNHCVGVMLLLKMFGASEEEQVAGLLHDVSHTAFSHVIDFVVAQGGDEDFQDRNHERYIRSTDIPAILERHGLSVERIIDYHHFTLLEQDAPALCADRIDYSLREMDYELVKRTLASLTTKDGVFVFRDQAAAYDFAREFLRLQQIHWGGYESSTRFVVFGQLLRRAIDLGVISFDDFWKTDAEVVTKLRTSHDSSIDNVLKWLSRRSLADEPKRPEPMLKKFRHVDPAVIVGDGVARLSTLSTEFARELEQARRQNLAGVSIAEFDISSYA